MPEELNDVPEGGELIRADGQDWYLSYRLPEHDIPLLFHVDGQDQLERIVGADGDKTPDREVSHEELNRQGAIRFGTTEDLVPDADPFNAFVEDYRKEAEIRPSLRDPEVLGITLGAALEGREPTDSEIMSTDYWQSRTAEERDWEEFAAQDPESARRRKESNRTRVRDRFIEAGYTDPPDSLVSYYADRFTEGKIGDVELQDAVQRETDPFAPGASPFAGHRLEEGDRVVNAGGRSFIEDEEGNRFKLTGPGQEARFGDQAVNLAPEADFMTDGSNWWLQDAAGRFFRADGEGQVREAERIYGEPEQINPHTIPEDSIQGNFLDLMGGERLEEFDEPGRSPAPDGTLYTADSGMFLRTGDGSWYRATGNGQVREAKRIYGDPVRVSDDRVGPIQGNFLDAMGGQVLEQFDQPSFSGTAKEMFEGRDPSELPLGQEEEVRDMLHSYLGPMFAQGYGEEWINEWAGKLRNEGQGTQEALQQKLQGQFDAMFPEWAGQQMTYEDLAGPMRSLWQQQWGQQPDETDELWMKVLRTNDVEEASQILRKEGIERGNETVQSRFLEDSMSSLGQRSA